ncbi:hypothetical protein [Ramlibacter sp. Leaf400]|uniref:hypothetical protein n=1 Tax=Ramlibacter sp. Leaf400 TaxID=1736365 RepID=UPI00070171FE|nr:hypothetical protein [Ramlibacter sp. Leaf400]KQT09673.1 hypothetical protein ASG30_14065 [Ramlibacter sp. Leaf400]
MNHLPVVVAIACSATLLSACAGSSGAPSGGGSTGARSPMSFFVTSANPGKGADFGGLAGADKHCQALASAAGAGHRTWRAYLSTTASGGAAAVNARDRIGRGPWQNAKGAVVASSVEELHGTNKLSKDTALTEKGQPVSGSGDAVNNHDILTGSTPEGRSSTAANDTTCANWTSSTEGSALVGHHDRRGLRDDDASRSWNSSHGSRGCSLDALRGTGGGGLLYCFAAN